MSGKSRDLLRDAPIEWVHLGPVLIHLLSNSKLTYRRRGLRLSLAPATLFLSFMDRRAPQILSGTATLTMGGDSTSSSSPQPGYSGASCPTVNSICYGTPSSVPDSPTTDFSSTALWAVVIATLAAATFMGALLFYTRRRKRIRTRERIRALLWDVVHGVQDGTIEPAVLQRLIYGPGGISDHLQSPEIFEAWLPVIGQSTRLANGGTGNDSKRWGEMQPLSLTPPYAPPQPLQKETVSAPRNPLLQWPWRPPRFVDAAAPLPSEPTPLQDISKNKKKNSKGKRPFKLWVERLVDTGVLIAMPRLPPPNNDTNATPLVINCPIELGSASLTFQDNLLDLAVPPPSRFADLPGPRVVDPLSSALARHTQGRDGLFTSRVNHPLSSTGRNLNLNATVNTPHSQWVERRGLGGGTAAG